MFVNSQRTNKMNIEYKSRGSKKEEYMEKKKFAHCGVNDLLKESCFKLVSYPEPCKLPKIQRSNSHIGRTYTNAIIMGENSNNVGGRSFEQST